MPSRLKAQIQARALALRRRLALLLRGRFDPYPAPPTGLALSPSRAHFADYATAPLALSWAVASTREPDIEPGAWQQRARAKLAELLGLPVRTERPTAVRSEDRAVAHGLRRRRVYLRVSPAADVPLDLVWREDGPAAKPVMLCLQGHNAGAHLSWGEALMPADPLKIAAGADYGLQAAARGFFSVCIEQSCFGERREQEIARPSAHPCFDAAHHALLLGRTLLAERVADVMSAVTWLATQAGGLPIDAERVYAMGNSAGGETALYAAALDPRLSGTIASGCVGSFREGIGRRAGCPDSIIPGILDWLEYDDIVRLCAPRIVLAVSGRSDHIYPFAGAKAVIEKARPFYRLLGADTALAAVEGPGGHRFYPDLAWPRFLEMIAGTGRSAPSGPDRGRIR